MNTPQEKTEFTLIKDLLLNWIKHWYYFVISAIICAGLGVLYVKLKTPEFEILSKVVLRAENGDNSLAGMSLMKSLGIGKSAPGSNVQDEAELMASHGPLTILIKDLQLNKTYILSEYMGLRKTDLYTQTPINIDYPMDMPDTLSVDLEFSIEVKAEHLKIKLKAFDDKVGTYELKGLPGTIHTPYGEFNFSKTSLFNNYGNSFKLIVTILKYDYQAQIYSHILEIESFKKSSDIIDLRMINTVPMRAMDILNGVINVHNRESAKEKEVSGAETLDFINSRLQDVGKELEEADIRIKQFKEEYGLTDIEADASAYMDQATELMPLLITAESQLESLGLLDKYLSDPNNKYSPIPSFVFGKESEVLAKAIITYNDELAKRSDLLLSSKKESAVSQSIMNQINMMRSNILEALSNVKKSAQITVNNLRQKQRLLESKMKDVPIMEKKYLALKREQELKQAVFIYLQQKKEETSVTSVAVMPKLRVIDPPYMSRQLVAPNIMKVVLMVFFFGCVLIPIIGIYLEPFIKPFLKRKRAK